MLLSQLVGGMIGGLAIAVSIGSVTAAPFAALTVRKVNPERLIRIIDWLA